MKFWNKYFLLIPALALVPCLVYLAFKSGADSDSSRDNLSQLQEPAPDARLESASEPQAKGDAPSDQEQTALVKAVSFIKARMEAPQEKDISTNDAEKNNTDRKTNRDSPEIVNAREIILLVDNSMREIAAAKKDLSRTDGVFHGKIAKGDNLASILEKAGKAENAHYVEAAAKVFSLRGFREGNAYKVHTDPASGELRRFEYEINEHKRLVVEGGDQPQAKVEPIEYEVRLARASGVVDSNLFQTVADIGERPQLAINLVKLFGSEINFTKNLQDGDRFSVLVEKKYKDGQYKGYGRILAATFTNNKKTYEAYLYSPGKGRAQYYNARGENLRKAFLQSPLAVTRVTSRYTQSRLHPILGRARPHLGVDYGAPTGTPVKSVGDGTVTSRGWAGGYGNQIVIKHASGMESLYSHLSGFARGLKNGSRVSQGQVIGFVGSTGLSTGPHLDFRLKRNGEYLNPAKSINPRGEPVPSDKMADFKRVRDMEKAYLSGKLTMPNYTVDSLVALAVSSPPEDTQNISKMTPAKQVKKQKTSRRTVSKKKSRKRR